ncbi:MAG TPA: NTP transferase domain-containing protein [Gemmatimonadales bacterium]|nr:NTP transferase domain-containing protein [Gemmatimonadales bacterium]
MHGLILAGGEGSRLVHEGIETPKPLVQVGGQPLIVRLLEQLSALECETLTCMVRADLTDVFAVLHGRDFGRPFTVVSCRTPSSLHTLVGGLGAVGEGNVFCTMVDSVMPSADWRAVYDGATTALARGADAVLAVTPFVDDESPLHVRTDPNGFVLELPDSRETTVPAGTLVTGGVYAFSPGARTAATNALARGVTRMRGFLRDFVARGARIATLSVARIIDVDHASDLRLANVWMTSAGPGPKG